jgi:hypothetical protein
MENMLLDLLRVAASGGYGEHALKEAGIPVVDLERLVMQQVVQRSVPHHLSIRPHASA